MKIRMTGMTVAAISTIVAAAGVANAGFTNVNVGGAISTHLGGAINGASTGTPSSEGGMGSMSVVQILNQVYGTGLNRHTVANTIASVSGSIQGTLTFSSGVTATRIQDFGGATSDVGSGMHLGDATGIDQVWRDGTVSSSATAKFAGANQYFSYRYNTGPTVGAPSLFTNVNGFNQTASATFNLIPGGDFRWIRADNSNGTGNIQTSRASDNANGADRMITFFISGTGITRPTYMVFFEDRAGGDNDYNDLAIELQVIPLPTGAAMGMAGLGLLAIRRRAAR